ncbi:hypothetical protein KC727_00905 [Candidatus Kaiserbacteria bacterium]|nr:hypothetical protein [Candidatus Kaiserbacteria bacterium]
MARIRTIEAAGYRTTCVVRDGKDNVWTFMQNVWTEATMEHRDGVNYYLTWPFLSDIDTEQVGYLTAEQIADIFAEEQRQSGLHT